MAENVYDRVNDYGSVKIQLASPNDIRSWSFGEVKKPETINYRTYRAERDGLFCERIFGPERDWECSCGKYKGTKYKGIICDRCGVKVTHSRVRRKRMGHINLAAPITHIWFFKALPSRLGALLDMKTSDIEKIVYFQDYVITNPGKAPLKRKQLLTEDEYREAYEKYGDDFEAEMGAEAIKKLLIQLDIAPEIIKVREDIEKTGSKQKLKDLTKRLKMLEAIRGSENKAEWMVMDVIPVIPPDLRPLVMLESGNFATSDLNDLYRRIINRNNRLKKLVDLNAPEVIIRNEKRMLQQAVDALFDNGRCRRPVLGSSNRPLKSLTDMIKGKQGRFRENLLGKRVDYSARSVIVVGPELKLHQCGLPKKIALELYQPFIIRKLKEHGLADTIKSAKRMLERRDPEVWDILEEVIYQHPVMLNRAPTLHRMGIQAFEPVLVEGNAIKIHPLVCKGFNADFDGDQMAVHLPLSIEAQAETHVLMLSPHNIFSPANGSPIISPSQDIVLGNYYITAEREGDKGEFMLFNSRSEAILAFEQKKIRMHSRIFVRLDGFDEVVENDSAAPVAIEAVAFKQLEEHRKRLDPNYTVRTERPANYKGRVILTTVGRVILSDILPKGMPFYNYALTSGGQSRVIADTYAQCGRPETIDLLDKLKALGFKRCTLAGLSFGITDIRTPATKATHIADGQKKADQIEKQYKMGAITELERYQRLLEVWAHARKVVTEDLMVQLKEDFRDADLKPVEKGTPGSMRYLNPINMMATSKARGSVDQMRQLGGMRGLMAKPSGEIIETPIKANFREGLSVLEYFSSTHGARKGLADTALKTADSGYLTRKLCDVAQNVVVNGLDCGTANGVTKSTIYKGETVEVELKDMVVGRVARDTVRNPITDETIVKENQIITIEIADALKDLKIESVRVRSPLTCQNAMGVCARCYGVDMSTSKLVEEGLAAGIIAAQSIGEPGTQLTMRTFHTGGVATGALVENDIKSSGGGTIEHRGINAVETTDAEGSKKLVALRRNGKIAVVDAKGRDLEEYKVPYGATVLVADGEKVKAKQQLAIWDPHMAPILAEKGGKVQYEDIEPGETVKTEEAAKGTEGGPKLVVIEHKGERKPRITILDKDGKIQDFHYLPAKARIEVGDGDKVSAGQILARQPKEGGGQTQDITGGLPRVTELFEARKPKDSAVLAEISGTVELRSDKRRGKMTIIIRNESGMERDHHVPQGVTLAVHTGDVVEAGDALVRGPVIPHDILRIKGEESLYAYLLTEIQNVYRSQGVKINDKHIEVIIAQMLRKVKVDDPGDTKLLPGEVIDRYKFQAINNEATGGVKIVEAGGTEFKVDDIVERSAYRAKNEEIEAAGGQPAKGKKPKPARGKTMLLGITKASLQSESFISAASFQETTKVLTEAAMAGQIDTLVGLKENVILGHLIPAGTAYGPHVNIKIKRAGGATEPEYEPRHQPVERPTGLPAPTPRFTTEPLPQGE
ncbi:MAG: DNA-directed RNA polymerase subunit beta' [Tepidisphaeraceae bacterium]